MRKLLRYMAPYKKQCVLAPLFKMLEASFELFVPLVVAAMIDHGIGEADRGYIYRMGFVLVLLGIIGLACAMTAQYYSARAAVGFVTRVKSALFAHIQELSYTEIDTLGTSSMITRMTSDINQVQNGVNLTLRLLLRSPFVVFGAMIMAFTVDAKAAIVFVVVLPLLCLVVFGIMLFNIPMYKKVQNRLDYVLASTRENLTGARVIRAFNKQEDEIEAYRESTEALNKLQLFAGKISGLMNPVTYVIVNGGIIALIWSGAIRVDTGAITQGELTALLNYMSQILVELIKMASLIISITRAVACGNRIQSVFEIVPSMTYGKRENEDQEDYSNKKCEDREYTDGENQVIKGIGTDDRKQEVLRKEIQSDAGNKTTEKNRNEKKDYKSEKAGYILEFDHVSFRYANAGAEALSDLNFSVKRGETVGIIGGTGSGKTSLVNLVSRFYDATQGEIRLKGYPIQEYSRKALQGMLGIVPQKAVLFAGTIEENLRWRKKDASLAEINRALEISQSMEFVSQKPEGLQTWLEQGGKNLSGGQRQRLTIARALVGDPEILILDDSASALDFATDAKLRMAIRQMEKAPVVFIVSQRAASIQYADQIIVLDDGEAVGIGSHEELLSTCSVYQEIYYSQFPKEGAAV